MVLTMTSAARDYQRTDCAIGARRRVSSAVSRVS
jgi:hypothetical protein